MVQVQTPLVCQQSWLFPNIEHRLIAQYDTVRGLSPSVRPVNHRLHCGRIYHSSTMYQTQSEFVGAFHALLVMQGSPVAKCHRCGNKWSAHPFYRGELWPHFHGNQRAYHMVHSAKTFWTGNHHLCTQGCSHLQARRRCCKLGKSVFQVWHK